MAAHGKIVANHSWCGGRKRQQPRETTDTSIESTVRANIQDTQYSLGIANEETNISRPFKTQRLQPPGLDSSPDFGAVSAKKYDPLTNSPPALSDLQPEALHIIPSTFARALQRCNLDHYPDAWEDLDTGSKGKANAEEFNEGKEEAITESCHAESQSSSPPKPILMSPNQLQMVRAKFYSLRDERRNRLRKQYAPVNQANHDALSENRQQQPILPTFTNENKGIHHPPHHPGKPNTIRASQESFEDAWLDDMRAELGPDGKITVEDAGYRS